MPIDLPDWGEVPDQITVREAILKRGSLRGQLQLLNCELVIEGARIGVKKPRDPHARVVGLDEQSGEPLLALQREIAEVKRQLDNVEADIDYLLYHKDIFKALAYKERY